MAFDIVGDVHGHAVELERLLTLLGYREQSGRWRHPDSRHLVFVGDLIDRGPDQLRVLEIARRMRDAGNASIVMGNHEFNAIGWATQDPNQPNRRLRDNAKSSNRIQHKAFLEQVGEGSLLHCELISWFKTLPLWLDMPRFRVVHACWDQPSISILKAHLSHDDLLTEEALFACYLHGSNALVAAETVLKGKEVVLPGGAFFHDKDGTRRNHTRVRWWDRNALTYRSSALCDEDVRLSLPNDPLPVDAIVAYDDAKPVFFGHYWLRADRPFLVSDMRSCLDFSVAKGGHLLAYRWDGEPTLNTDNLVWV